uniref:Uncharacterized protein n=1 Tax=Pelagomonas calceolata TaxID=35677 RepID=A0A7S3ZVS2_9STRA|mmetsp:Transcript_9404/g.27533  ORF Transcript_9404/g.27533 Transcript_9404/m.27533 type:complete len:143 (+) Transcript_9404:624-1052(+)
MSAWFHNRCTFKDQYALWHTILKLASRFGCLDYDEVFGANWRTDKESMCVVAFEPNPRHRAWLTRQAVAYQRRGWRYVAVFAAVGAGASDATSAAARRRQCINQIVATRAPRLNHDLHTIDARPARWCGSGGLLPLDSVIHY